MAKGFKFFGTRGGALSRARKIVAGLRMEIEAIQGAQGWVPVVLIDPAQSYLKQQFMDAGVFPLTREDFDNAKRVLAAQTGE